MCANTHTKRVSNKVGCGLRLRLNCGAGSIHNPPEKRSNISPLAQAGRDHLR